MWVYQICILYGSYYVKIVNTYSAIKHLAGKRESQHVSLIRPQIECFVVDAFIFVKFIVKCLSSEGAVSSLKWKHNTYRDISKVEIASHKYTIMDL